MLKPQAGKRKLTLQEASLILLYEMNGRLGRVEASFDKRLEAFEKTVEALTNGVSALRRDMALLWNALAKLVEAQASTR